MATVADTRLGEILLRMGHVHQEQIDESVSLQSVRHKRLGDLLLDLGYVEEDQLLEALSEQFDIPFERDILESMDTSLTTKVPVSFIREYKMVPFRCVDGVYHVGVRDPVNLLPMDDVRLVLHGPVSPVLCREGDIQRILDSYFDHQGDNAADMIDDIALGSSDGEMLQTLPVAESDRDLMDLANEAPIIKLINLLITGAVKDRASDIHLEPFEREMVVRYRVDGVLYERITVPKAQEAAVVSRIKIMANLNIAEHRLPQDGRIKIRLSGKEIDIRVSVIPVQHGERVVMRILEKGSFLIGLEELGMAKRDYTRVDKIIRSSHGIFLVTGPTGSGKSTTLYASLQRVLSPEINVITVEDPVEYQMPGVGQIEVKPKIGLDFASALRSILRQDPDVILVGEIRDKETAEMAVHASLTGHLVFSTLHTNDSAGALTRLVNMGIEPFLVTSSTIAVQAQRLVREICASCKEPYIAEPASLIELGVPAEEAQNCTVYRGAGCPTCKERGYFGRSGIFELLMMTPKVQELTLAGGDSNMIKREAKKEGMRSLREDGTAKVLRGKSTIEEVLRVTRDDMLDEMMD